MSELTELFAEFNKQYKEQICSIGTFIPDCSRIPFSSPTANRMMYGGLPRGRVIEFFGDEGSGKTTTALDIAGNAQRIFEQEWKDAIADLESRDKLSKEQQLRLDTLRQEGPKKVEWIDHEHTFDDEWAEKLGVDVSKLAYISPGSQSAEEILGIVLKTIESGALGLVVIDSIGMMASQQEMDGDISESTYGGISRALTKFSKKVEVACARTNCMLIGINQVRENMQAGYGGPTYTTPGGKCWKHTCSVRLHYRAGKPFDSNLKDLSKTAENPYGHTVMISVAKTKVCKPDRKIGMYSLSYNNGILYMPDMISIAIKEDIIHKSGGWFTFINPETGEVICKEDEKGEQIPIKVQGENNIGPFLEQEENAELLKAIKAAVDKTITE